TRASAQAACSCIMAPAVHRRGAERERKPGGAGGYLCPADGENRVGRKGMLRRAPAALLIAIPAGLILWAGLSMLRIYLYSTETDPDPADAAIVLGAAEYNNRPSPVFKERINHAVDLYNEGGVKALIFTGGAGTGSPYAESEVGRDYAVKKGVPPGKI